MDAQQYNDGLAELRGVRDDIKKVQAALSKLTGQRDKYVKSLAGYAKAKADRLAPAAGLSIQDIVALAPNLAPEPVVTAPAGTRPPTAPVTTSERTGAAAPALTPVPAHVARTQPVGPDTAPDPAAELLTQATAPPEPPASSAAPAPDGADAVPRELPSIPEGPAGDRFFTVAPNLRSERPNFTQTVRPSAILNTDTGVLVYKDQRVRLDLGAASADEILTAVFASVPDSVQRIYVTGAPWHRDADSYPYLRDAVRAWLDAPMPHGWTVETQRGRDAMAGHFLHERTPVGRWQRGADQHVEIRNVAEWFDPRDADPGTIRAAFNLTWEALKREWPDVVLMGSPMQTGRDLWTRTIPTKQGARWADGYPVMSDEIRQLMHATSGQGRDELITPPRVPAQLPRLAELDRTLAYGKHTWASGVGAPQRVTAGTFASWSEKDQANALFAPSHWQVRVTIPDDWNHVGLLPAAIEGPRAWHYPHEAGRTFTTWAGGAEVNAALRNPITPWKIEILDGLLWESGTPLKDWSEKLKKAWASLAAKAQLAGTDDLREANRLASRAIRSILLYGIGGFAQRPTITTGTVPVGHESQIPKGARPKSLSDGTITWEQSRMSRNPNAHPEWAAGVWSAARAALLSTRAKTADGQMTHVGALHLKPGSIVAFRTDAIYTTDTPRWPYNGEPGDYLLKGLTPDPVAAPLDMAEFYNLQALGRARLDEAQAQS
ncbi:Mucin-19 [Streptomyces sp. H10-C2]|uniref:Mucin-19 n=1 Tax=unclassified Streptomyces TaxID=2593676 RepID=UPI0024BAAC8E|nr:MULTISPECIES: Mucin-19 [unclassified Streptomyces]MDJ0342829.1 Mucin-19 [Streptomyces sp. PH10-H1]MDJ0372507.1 Mucin-19 [Streptomyces sp. H10-C2]